MDNKNGDFCLATSKVCDFLTSDCGHVIVCKVFDWPVFLYSWGYNTTCSLGKHLTPLEVVFGVFMWTEMFFRMNAEKSLLVYMNVAIDSTRRWKHSSENHVDVVMSQLRLIILHVNFTTSQLWDVVKFTWSKWLDWHVWDYCHGHCNYEGMDMVSNNNRLGCGV